MGYLWVTLAVFSGMLMYDIMRGIVWAVIRIKEDRDEEKNHGRQIGFGNPMSGHKQTEPTQMRKIGFGANDSQKK